MDYEAIDDIGDMKCATKVARRGEKYVGMLKVDREVRFDMTALCDNPEQAKKLLVYMVGVYRKGLKSQGAWGAYVRCRFIK